MRGQFFIISSVIIISALVAITQYMYDFGKVDLTRVEELRETSYVHYVKDALLATTAGTYQMAGCNRLDAELNATEKFLADKLLGNGLMLVATHDISGCPASPVIKFRFNLTAANFRSETSFSYIV